MGDEEGNDKAARVMAMGMATRVVGDEEGKGSKAMAKGARMAGEQW